MSTTINEDPDIEGPQGAASMSSQALSTGWGFARVRRLPKILSALADARGSERERQDVDKKDQAGWKPVSWKQPLKSRKGGSVLEPYEGRDQPGCVGFAVAAAMRAYFAIYEVGKERKARHYKEPFSLDKPLNPYLLWGLANARTGGDPGGRTTLREALRVANLVGTPPGLTDPSYEDVASGRFPSSDELGRQLQRARPYKIQGTIDAGGYLAEWVKLLQRGPLVADIRIHREEFDAYSSDDYRAGRSIGWNPKPAPREGEYSKRFARHVVLVVGYDAKRGFEILNSFGLAWGGEGFAWVNIPTAQNTFVTGQALIVGESNVAQARAL